MLLSVFGAFSYISICRPCRPDYGNCLPVRIFQLHSRRHPRLEVKWFHLNIAWESSATGDTTKLLIADVFLSGGM